MKKAIKIAIISVVSLIILAFLVLSFTTFNYNGFECNFSMGKVQIVGCTLEDENIEFPSKVFVFPVTSISNCEISNKTKTVKIEDGISTINNSFSECQKLEKITLPESLNSILGKSFFDCNKLKSINLPKNLKKIQVVNPVSDDQLAIVFSGCSSLERINVDSENSVFKSVDGVLYNYSKNMLIKCPEAKNGKVIIPDWCESVYRVTDFESPLSNCYYVTSISFPQKFKLGKIQDILSDTNLKSVVIDENHNKFKSVDGVCYTKNMKTIKFFPKMFKNNFIMPDTVVELDCKFEGETIVLGANYGINEKYDKDIDLDEQSAYFSIFDCIEAKNVQISPKNPKYSIKNNRVYLKENNHLIYDFNKQ